ncbi:MAG: LysR family transcriptional regulator [Hyphomicrobiales bacterium]|nr:LysR family transcriptional regulator [Hyphomicrobiales bacterium]MBV9429386.1 LysR family transcriptional regulator [Bradyrhizobiaceae bacterium]
MAQFVAFARAGSMPAAAKALRVRQSTIDRGIAELGESLGRRLVEPHGGGCRQELQSTPG